MTDMTVNVIIRILHCNTIKYKINTLIIINILIYLRSFAVTNTKTKSIANIFLYNSCKTHENDLNVESTNQILHVHNRSFIH